MFKKFAAAAMIAGLAAAPAFAQEKVSPVEVGVLTCEIIDVTNVVVYTEQEFACTFDPAANDNFEAYRGQISKIGIDLSVKNDFTIIWAVFAPSQNAYEPKALKGTYVGAGADVAVGVGAGANILVGGGKNSFTLQPISVAGVEGAGVSVGIETFELD